MDSVACGCVNASGQMDNHGDCIYVAGDTRANVGDVSGLVSASPKDSIYLFLSFFFLLSSPC